MAAVLNDYRGWDKALPVEEKPGKKVAAMPLGLGGFIEWLPVGIFLLILIPPVRRSPYLSAAGRLLLGVIFIQFALSKIMRPAVFALNVVDYAMMPAWGVNLWALVLPWAELVAGLFLILGIRTRAAATLIGGMNIIFIVGLVNVILQGLPITCSCVGEAGEPVTWWKVLKNSGMLVMAIQIFLYELSTRATRNAVVSLVIRRSTLILPINVPRFVEKAHLRGADAVMLDLEDAVPAPEKASARRLVREAIALVSRGGAEVFVRVNHDPAHLWEDLEASVWPTLDGICLPKTESAGEIERLEAQVADLERRRGIAPGRIELTVIIETPRGVLNAEAIAGASRRIRSVSLGPEDFCLALGVEPSARLRKETPDLFLILIKEWLYPTRKSMWFNGIQALVPLISSNDFDNLPLIFEIISPILKASPAALQFDLEELLITLHEKSPDETLYFIQQMLKSTRSELPAIFVRRMLPDLPPEFQTHLREILRNPA